jgi:hypothetical protein
MVVVVDWTRMQRIRGSNPFQVKIILVHATAMLLFYIIQSIIIHVLYCSKFFCHTLLHGHITSGAVVDLTSQVCSSAMLVLPTVGNIKIRFYGRPQWHNVYTKFHSDLSSSSWVYHVDRQTDTASSIYVSIMRIVQCGMCVCYQD